MSDNREKKEQNLDSKTAQTPQNDQITKEQQLKELIEKHRKEVAFNGLSSELRIQFDRSIKDLETLRNEVLTTENKFLEKTDLLQAKLHEMENSGKIKMDKDLDEKHNAKVQYYKRFLDVLISEIDVDLVFCKSLVSENPPKTLTVFDWYPESVDDVLQQRLKSIKSMIKKFQKDLRVSFSKYDYNFGSQIKDLEWLDLYLKNLEKGTKNK
jgi:hypothetical protein